MAERRPPYGAAVLAGLAIFALYLVTLAPSTAFWDTSEYIATAHILGIPHPPGNALFVALARTWSVLLSPLGLPVAVRLNLFAAATSASASALLFLVAHRVLAPVLGDGRRALLGAALAALVGATAFTVWNQSTVNEKVYTLSVLVIAAVTWLGVLWADRRDAAGSERYLLWALFLMALGSTNHLMSVLPLPALALMVLVTKPSVFFRPALLGRALLLGVLGLSFNFFLPVRAAQDPVINEGAATCGSFVGAAAAIFTNGKLGDACPMLADNLTRKQYQKPSVDQRMAPLSDQWENYYQYFDWQWGRGADPSELPGTARLPLTLLFTSLGLLGLWAVFRADRGVFLYVVVLVATLSIGLVYYLNFKFGFSLAPHITDQSLHEVRERDYFFVGSFMIWGVLAGIGLSWTWAKLASLSANARRWLLTSPVLLVAVIPLPLNWSWAGRAGDYAARDWAYDLLMSVEPYGVLFTNGDNDTFPLWYLQEVEGFRKDVTVVVGQYLQTSWYPKQIRDLTAPDRQRPFDPDQGAGVYVAPARPPARAVTGLTDEEMDGIVGAQLDADITVPFPQLAVTYPAGAILNRMGQLALAFIHDSAGERPIYFAASAGLMRELGLDPWAVRHGLAVKLELRDLDGEQPAHFVEGSPEYGGDVFHLERSLKLYQEVYQFRSIRDRPIWQDRATLNIPWFYYALALQLSDVARVGGADPEWVTRLETDALAFQVVAGGGPKGTPGS
ncbi:MAG TPA: DUF2723 domain-containing protein [Longimicrobiales bacterium]|nr:DUF2723 domain-containing protein [Longimicrobiales bacterium]